MEISPIRVLRPYVRQSFDYEMKRFHKRIEKTTKTSKFQIRSNRRLDERRRVLEVQRWLSINEWRRGSDYSIFES